MSTPRHHSPAERVRGGTISRDGSLADASPEPPPFSPVLPGAGVRIGPPPDQQRDAQHDQGGRPDPADVGHAWIELVRYARRAVQPEDRADPQRPRPPSMLRKPDQPRKDQPDGDRDRGPAR